MLEKDKPVITVLAGVYKTAPTKMKCRLFPVQITAIPDYFCAGCVILWLPNLGGQ
jgi:hypothetical protein